MELTVTDIAVLGTIAISFLFGAWRGLVKEALSLVCWIAAVVLAIMFNDALAPRLLWISETPAVQKVAATALIFVGTVFGGSVVSNLVSMLTSAAGLKAADRALGALFGVIRGVVVVTLVVMLTADFELVKPYYSEARTVPYLMVLAQHFRDLLGLEAATGFMPATVGTD
ncbi:MAG: CvpA family protein [Pseudohongiellaceae bacterium]|jgi:membrane protein required for colicin V production